MTTRAQTTRTPESIARAARIQAALATITEVEASQGQTLAATPVLITYESSNALTGLGSSQANFRTAGQTLETSLGQLVQVLASVGPWLLLMLLVVLILRWIIHGRPVGSDRDVAYAPAPQNGHYEQQPYEQRPARDNRNLIQRWFSRDEEDDGRG